jgi:hypothetical protein
MTAVQCFSIWSVIVSVFIIGGFAAGAGEACYGRHDFT